MKRLPRSLDEIGGLRVARWIRESTAGQYDRYGPASQREQQDRFIERHGARRHGARVPGRPQRHARSGSSGDDDRDARPRPRRAPSTCSSPATPTAGSATCAARSSCSRTACIRPGWPWSCATGKILSSDPRDWDELIVRGDRRRAVQPPSVGPDQRRLRGEVRAPRRSRRPRRRSGFRRLPEPPHTLEIDPDTHRHRRRPVRALCPGHRQRRSSSAEETGLAASRIRCILMNPLYNGWVRAAPRPGEPPRGRVARRTRRCPTSCGRGSRRSGGPRPAAAGPRNRGRVDLLGGLLECVCGRRVRSDGTFADGRHRKLHPRAVRGVGPRRPDSATRHGSRPSWPSSAEHPARRRHDRRGGRSPRLEPAPGRHRARPGRATAPRARPGARRRGRIDDDDLPGPAASAAGAARRRSTRDEQPRVPAGAGGRVAARHRRGDRSARTCPRSSADLVHAIYERIVVAGPEIRQRPPHAGRLRSTDWRWRCHRLLGAPDRIRTCDLRLRRPTLYPLSYRRADRDDTR